MCFGRGATLMVDYGLPGVIWLMIGLLVVQIIAVYFWGVEPARQPFEWLDPRSQTPSALSLKISSTR